MRPFVVICVASGGQPHWKFQESVERMRFHALKCGIDTDKRFKRGCYVQHNRNLLVDEVVTKMPDATHLLFLDDDMTYPPALIPELLKAGKDIVLAQYYRKYYPYTPIVAVYEPPGKLVQVYVDPVEKGGVHRVSSGGTGAMLIRKEVFDKVPFPWFQTHYGKIEELPEALRGEDSNHSIRGNIWIGEDVWFCSMAQEAGFALYCHFGLILGHIDPDREVTFMDYIKASHERDKINHTDQS